MKQFSKDLGNVSIAPKGKWSREQEYEKLALVYNAYNNLSYVAKINVPSGVDIENREYWQPMNATGYADNNFINLTAENENGTITAYESIEEAIATIVPINRKVGATLSFYNLNADRLDRQAEFELWQFNSTDLANWENKDYWNNIYYNWNVFAGWYVGVDALNNHVEIPNVGQYAYVGSNLNDAILYQCRTNGTWTNTGIKVRNYISVVVSGNITIGENGNWFSDGEDTGIPATPAVDEQLDNIIMQLQQHTTEINNLKTSDANLQDQITSNYSDITNLTAKHESLSRTVQGIAATGGASTATNVTYNNDASGLNAENAQDAIDKLSNSENIKYNNKTSGLEAGNVQKAIDETITKLYERSTIKSIVFPQSNIVNIDLDNNKVIISKGTLFVTYYNSNYTIINIQEQQIDISAKLNYNSALFFNLNNNTFEFLNYKEQNVIDDKYYIVALLYDSKIYYLSCDIYVNGKLFGPINAQNQVKDIINELSDSLGDSYGNMVTGSDLLIGYNDSDWNLNALSMKGVNANIVRELSTEISKYVFKATVKSGSNVTASYRKATIRSFEVNIPQKQKFYVGVRYKVNKSSLSVPLSLEVLANDYTWLNGLNGKNRFCPLIDGKWHYRTFEVSLDSAAVTKLEFAIFLSGGSPYTYTEDCSIEFTDLLLSMSKAPKYSSPQNEKDYAALNEYDNIQSLKSNGILWSNLVAGSDMEKGYEQSNILAFSTYPTLGGTVERVLDNETSRYCIKAHFPTGTEFTSANNYVYPSLMKAVRFTGEDTTQEFSISFRYKCSPNFIGFCPLCNDIWMQYLRSDGAWRNLTPTIIPLVKDNNWHYAHIVTRKTDVSNKTYSVALYAYFAVASAVTLEDDLDFCITDIVISPSRFPDYSVVRNVNDYLSSVDNKTLQSAVNEIISKYPDAHGCVFMSLGDSITTEGYYINKLRQLLSPSKYYNLAVASATWADRTNTTSYDGNPQFKGDQNQNVLGNQLQKIINNPDVYNVAPDIIIISAGTNDGQPVPISTSLQDIIANIDTHFYANSAAIPITNPTFDDSDTYMNHRKTIAGSMRYVVCKLQEMYPNARIYILTPIQGCHSQRDYGSSIAAKQLYISEVAKHLGVPVIHVGEECGIQADFEYQGAMWTGPSGSNEKSGRDLVDGLHPNTSGGWKMAKYIARKLLNDYVNQSY